MPLQPISSRIRELGEKASKIERLTRQLNLSAANLNGVAAVVPADVPPPLNAFKGSKVILHNVSYDAAAGGIAATVTIPYRHGLKGERRYSGGHFKYYITENWFND